MKSNTGQFYNLFYFVYPLVDLFFKPQKRELTRIIQNLPPGNLLELGIGKGSSLKQYHRHLITGIDISDKMLQHASKHSSSNVQLLNMDAEHLDFDNHTFDYIIASHIVSTTKYPDKIISEAERVLKHNGRLFILNHFTPNNPIQYLDLVFSYISPLFHYFPNCLLLEIQF